MKRITITLTEYQAQDLRWLLDREIDKCSYYIERYDGQIGTQVLSKRQERAFMLRLKAKLAKS